MTKDSLSGTEIQELAKRTADVFSFISDLKKNYEICNHIQYPKIPQMLSESLAVNLIEQSKILKELTGHKISLGGVIADVKAESKNNSTVKIEVKSTGKSAFQEFGPKDIIADYLVWIHFGGSFLTRDFSKVQAYTIKNPNSYFKKPIKITLDKLKQVVGKKLIQIEFNLEKIN